MKRAIIFSLILLAAATSARSQNTFPTTGNVGIGTMNPSGALHILEPGAPPLGLPAQENGLLLGSLSTGGYKWIQSYGGILSLNRRGNNVAIGRASATHLLDINGATRVRANNSTNLLVTGQGDDVFLDLVKDVNTTVSARIELEGFSSQTTHEGEIVFSTKHATDSSLQERMRIGARGDITMGPAGQLHVGQSFGRQGVDL